MKGSLFFTTLVVLALAASSERLPDHDLVQDGAELTISTCGSPSTVHRAAHRDLNFKHQKRTEEEAWDDALCKGGQLLAAMKGSDTDAGKLYKPERATGQSPFRDISNDLTKWGYTNSKVSPDPDTKALRRQLKIEDSMEDNGLDHGGTVFQRSIRHYNPDKKDQNGQRVAIRLQTYTANGHEYRATGAWNSIMVDHTGGAMYATLMMSAGEGAKSNWGSSAPPKREDLPELCQFSDAMWGAWNMDLPHQQLKNIKYYYSWDIQNQDTEYIYDRILEESDDFLDEWPGKSYGMDSEQGKRLLGSPNGRVVGYFLSQHKAELGQKTVTKVNIFHSTHDAPKAVLAFTIADVTGTTEVHAQNANQTAESINILEGKILPAF